MRESKDKIYKGKKNLAKFIYRGIQISTGHKNEFIRSHFPEKIKPPVQDGTG